MLRESTDNVLPKRSFRGASQQSEGFIWRHPRRRRSSLRLGAPHRPRRDVIAVRGFISGIGRSSISSCSTPDRPSVQLAGGGARRRVSVAARARRRIPSRQSGHRSAQPAAERLKDARHLHSRPAHRQHQGDDAGFQVICSTVRQGTNKHLQHMSCVRSSANGTCTPRIRSRVSFSAVSTLRSDSFDMRQPDCNRS
jgi:hypothetical protein